MNITTEPQHLKSKAREHPCYKDLDKVRGGKKTLCITLAIPVCF